MSRKSYRVGYGKPPKHTRFKPGQSGNPKGRPKGAQGFTAELDRELKAIITVTENGQVIKLSKQRALVKSLLAKALKGDAKSVALILTHSNDLRGDGALQATELEEIDKLILQHYRAQQGARDSDAGSD
jgi:hypothetical protein